MCTSASTAWRATSAGVWNSGPTSTSKPRSANPVAITFWPRSWPSWPILATRMRGRRPSASSKAAVAARAFSIDDTRPASSRYTPEIVRIWAACRPYTFSRASEISPTVALARAASMARASRFCSSPGPRVPFSAASAPRVSASSAARVAASSRSSRSLRSFSICCARTAALSTLRTSISSSDVGAVLVDADDRLAPGVDAGLGAGGRLLDPQLRQPLVDRPGHAAGLLDLGDVAPRAAGEVVGEPLDVGAAAPRVDDLGRARLLLQQELGVAGDAGREVGRQGERLVQRVGVQPLRVPLRGGHRLDAGADRRCCRRPAR